MRRLAVTPAGTQGVEVVGYAVNCQGVVGTVEARLVTSWQQLQCLIIDAESTIEDETEQVLGKELQRIADEEFGLCRSTDMVTDRNTQAAEANQVLNHVLIEAYLCDKRGTDGRVPFWQVDAELEMRLGDLQGEMWLSGVPRSKLRLISQHLLIDHGILDAPDGDPIKIPTIHLRAARDTARRVANGIRKRKSEITVDSVLASLRQRM